MPGCVVSSEKRVHSVVSELSSSCYVTEKKVTWHHCIEIRLSTVVIPLLKDCIIKHTNSGSNCKRRGRSKCHCAFHLNVNLHTKHGAKPIPFMCVNLPLCRFNVMVSYDVQSHSEILNILSVEQCAGLANLPVTVLVLTGLLA